MSPYSPTNYKEPIFLGYKQCQKLHCGLQWDAKSGAVVASDLDLGYAAFDEYGDLVELKTGKTGARINEDGTIYHSGDDEDGADSADDERITLNLFSLARKIHHVFLFVEISSDHVFGKILNPVIRLSQGADLENTLEVNLGGTEGEDEKAFAFVRLERTEGGWMLHYLGKYGEGGTVPQWPELFAPLIPTAAEGNKNRMLPAPKPGEIVPLFYSEEAGHRVICGLSWDAASRDDETDTPYDLDLTCVMFDHEGTYYDYVSTDRAIDDSGAVYHSGDDMTGAGGGDDEQISAELRKLPEEVCHIVFIVEAKSRHSLGEINKPEIRIGDGLTDRTQMRVSLQEGGENNACIFAHIYHSEEGWQLHHIGAYLDANQIEDWSEPAKRYLAVG